MTAQNELRFTCTPQLLLDEDGTFRRAFKFNAIDTDTGKVVYSVNDICSREQDARELEELFRRNRVSPRHIIDVLEDWVTYH